MPTVATATGTLFMVSILLDLLAHILVLLRVFFPSFNFSFVAKSYDNFARAEKKEERGEKRNWDGEFRENLQLLFNATGPMQLGKICWVHASGGGERPGRAWQRHGEMA
jgi:amino acid transporter